MLPEGMTLKDIQEQYEGWALTYEEDASEWSYSSPKKIAKQFKKYLHKGMDIADLGCGTGLNKVEYKGLKLKWAGLDYSTSMLDIARQKGYQTVQGDICKMPFPDNRFDASICTAVLEYFPDIKPYIKEMKRVVKHSGIITFTTACTQIDGLFRTSKKQLENILGDYSLNVMEIFKILSHKEYKVKPIYFWVTSYNRSKTLSN